MVGGYRVLPSFFRVHSRLWRLMAGDYSFRFRHGSKGRFGVGLRWNEDVWGNSVKNPVRVASADWSTRYRRAGPLRGTGSAFRFAYRRRNDQSRPFPPSFFFIRFHVQPPSTPQQQRNSGAENGPRAIQWVPSTASRSIRDAIFFGQRRPVAGEWPL